MRVRMSTLHAAFGYFPAVSTRTVASRALNARAPAGERWISSSNAPSAIQSDACRYDAPYRRTSAATYSR